MYKVGGVEMCEKWLPVRGYEGKYEVSDRGRVMSLERTTITSSGILCRRKGRLLVQRPTKDGYLRVVLCDGSKKEFYVHRLVAEAFLSNSGNLPQVNHINCIPSDNKLENLEFVSASANRLHSLKMCCPSKKGIWHPRKRIIDCKLQKTFYSAKEWAIAKGTTVRTALNVINKKTNKSKLRLIMVLKIRHGKYYDIMVR